MAVSKRENGEEIVINFNFEPAVPELECVHQGKVRDTFAIPFHPDLLLAVATDRVSTHNVIHESTIPNKGHALTAQTVFWMSDKLSYIRNHLVAYGQGIYGYVPSGLVQDLNLRAIVIRKCEMIPVEFIFRSYMAGSLWKDYYSQGLPNPYGIDLPTGLQLMSPFEETIFTPTDKSETDDPLDAAETARKYNDAYHLARHAYMAGRKFAATRGIEIIDGKFEVGIGSDGQVVLCDECLTSDSSRFVKSDDIAIGREPTWLDKQYLREEAERMWAGGKKVPLTFSRGAIWETMLRYQGIVESLTGYPLPLYQNQHLR